VKPSGVRWGVEKAINTRALLLPLSGSGLSGFHGDHWASVASSRRAVEQRHGGRVRPSIRFMRKGITANQATRIERHSGGYCR